MKALKVSQLNDSIKEVLEGSFTEVWVEGEISNLRVYSSGHLYFTLKDERSQIRAVMFRGFLQQLAVMPKEGDAVVVRASVNLYAPRGEYQLVVKTLSPLGVGELYQRFMQMKEELQRLGWFDADKKQDIPKYPQIIGVVTSPSGAAVRDIINIVVRRAPWIKIIIYPTLVQGTQAAPQIADAIALAGRRRECDLLIVGRGGGSLEDLWPFNERVVAQAILESKIPIISAVGHEIDFSISDFVADLRAPTPSAAAELATAEDRDTIEIYLEQCRKAWIGRLDDRLSSLEYRLSFGERELAGVVHRVQEGENRLQYLQQQLKYRIDEITHNLEQRIDRGSALLEALNPERVLQRGYAVIRQNERILASCKQAQVGQVVEIGWCDGWGSAKLLEVEELVK